MTIAVIAVGYQCQNLTETLAPWLGVKNLRSQGDIEFKICCVSALFKERWERGEFYENKENADYLNSLKKEGLIDEFIEIKKPILDYESRVAAWNYLKAEDIDFIWEFDMLDEYYSFNEIIKTCQWIKENNLYDFYRINFKNYFGKLEDKTYVLDFEPVRILNNKRRKGVRNFYFDNDVEFNDGKRTPFVAGKTIPTSICHPKHLSWVGDENFLKAKIDYQKAAINTCSWRFCEEAKSLLLSKDYYNKINKPLPEILKDEK